MKKCALQGEGIIKLHHYAVAEALKKGELVEVLKGFDTRVLQIYLGYQSFRHMQTKLRHFIDFFVPKIKLIEID